MTQPTEATADPRLARLAAVRAANEKRIEQQASAAIDREIEVGDVLLKLETEVGGTRGVDFDIVESKECVIGIKRVDAPHIRLFDAHCAKLKKGEPVDVNEMIRFTVPAIVWPSAEKYREIVIGREGRPGADGLASRVTYALQLLHQGGIAEAAGKP